MITRGHPGPGEGMPAAGAWEAGHELRRVQVVTFGLPLFRGQVQYQAGSNFERA